VAMTPLQSLMSLEEKVLDISLLWA
jgi:hypothetical protein